jgi:hypothetical protein
MFNPYALLLPVIFGGVFVFAFWKAADIDEQPRWLWTGLSAAVFFFTFFYMGWGYIGSFFGQIFLAAAIAIVRAVFYIIEINKKP